MRVGEFKKLLEQFNDEDVVVVDVHDTVLFEDLYDFTVGSDISMGLPDGRQEVRISPVDHSETGKKFGVTWCADDIRSLGYECTDEQAEELLDTAVSKHDATVGINWDVLEDWCQFYLLKRKTRIFNTTVKFKDGSIEDDYFVMIGEKDADSVPENLDQMIFYYFEDMDDFDSYCGLPANEPSGEFMITKYREI